MIDRSRNWSLPSPKASVNWIQLFADLATIMGTIISDLLSTGILHPSPQQIYEKGLALLGKTWDDYKIVEKGEQSEL